MSSSPLNDVCPTHGNQLTPQAEHHTQDTKNDQPPDQLALLYSKRLLWKRVSHFGQTQEYGVFGRSPARTPPPPGLQILCLEARESPVDLAAEARLLVADRERKVVNRGRTTTARLTNLHYKLYLSPLQQRASVYRPLVLKRQSRLKRSIFTQSETTHSSRLRPLPTTALVKSSSQVEANQQPPSANPTFTPGQYMPDEPSRLESKTPYSGSLWIALLWGAKIVE